MRKYLVRIKHIFQFIHSIINNEFLVVLCFKKV